MPSPSKEDEVLELILENSPLKRWHFTEILKKANITKASLNKWLDKYLQEGILKKVKEKGKFPYFTAGENNTAYLSRKKQYMLDKLYKSGFIRHLLSIDAETIIIFGSTVRGDWYKNSDIDVFIYKAKKNIQKTGYEKGLKKEIEIHLFKNKKEINQVKTGLIKNIVDGYVVKGSIKDIMAVN
ncbi:MAG: nucleotidyltransferase domain-containing protein [Candidatus Woesearchaeota archaeon]